jgi:GGDEF domain-containing protein
VKPKQRCTKVCISENGVRFQNGRVAFRLLASHRLNPRRQLPAAGLLKIISSGPVNQSVLRKSSAKMNGWNKSTLKSLLVPGGLLLLAVALVLHAGLLTLALPGLTLLYYCSVAAGLLLAWRFHSSRVFFAVSVLLMAQQAISLFASGHIPITGPGRTAFEAVVVLLPLNFVGISVMRERGFIASGTVSVLMALFVESVAVGVFCRSSQVLSPATRALHHGATAVPFPNYTLVVLAVAAVVLLTRFFWFGRPVESGLLWSLGAFVLALRFGGTGRISTAYFAAATLILAISVIETSYLLAYHDELTTLPSRRAFNDALMRLQAPYSIAMVDIDHFKQFNDKHGHDTGDQVLKLVATKLARVTGGGRAYRCGGEEFAIVFPGRTTKEVVGHLEQLRSAIELSGFRTRAIERRQIPRGPDRRDQRIRGRRQSGRAIRQLVLQSHEPATLSVTVSIGVATSVKENPDVDRVIQAADKALYRAKAAGRNRVEEAVSTRRRVRAQRVGIA